MLAASFACNIAVLFLPFMNLRAGITSDPYSLINSIKMLWSSGLYVLAALVVGFSVVFPFAKLSVLAGICWAGRVDERSERLLGWVERLGKWSMLDVFIVCIILTLASGQLLVGAKPLAGIPVFVVAIILSILAGEVVAGGQAESPTASVISRPLMIRGGVWLALSGLAFVATVGFPFLRIRDWLLADNHYSIVTLVVALGREGALGAALINGLFLVLAPLATWILAVVWWWRLWRGRPAGESLKWVRRLKRWSMLDVFGLALAVFLVEGESLMHTEVRWGALSLVTLLVLQRISEATLGKAFAD
jgi:paraquat-inducible protein A